MMDEMSTGEARRDRVAYGCLHDPRSSLAGDPLRDRERLRSQPGAQDEGGTRREIRAMAAGLRPVADDDEVVKHMEPAVALSRGSAAWMPISTPTKLTFTTASTSSKGWSAKGPPLPMPALL